MLKSLAVIVIATAAALAASRSLIALASPSPPPPPAAEAGPQAEPAALPAAAAQVDRAADGHYWAEADVDGHWMRFLVDTGASSVALTAADAQRLGIDLDLLDFDRPVKTANGDTTAAAVTLDRVSIGGARMDKVDALVVREGLASSLLGMSYLGRLSRFEATPTALILRP